jgi:hypothetical protein
MYKKNKKINEFISVFFYYLKFFKDQFWIKIKLISRYKFKLLKKKENLELNESIV